MSVMLRFSIIFKSQSRVGLCPSGGKSQRGFTLFEVLIASIIMAFIAFAAVIAVRTVSGGRDKIEAFSQSASEMRFAANLVRKDLHNLFRNAKSENIKLVGYEKYLEAGPTSIITAYITNNVKARPGAVESDVYEVEYFVQQKEGRTCFMRRLQPNPFQQEEPGGILTVIAENIITFNVRYFDLNEDVWCNEWPEENGRLPHMIKVNLVVRVAGSEALINNSFMVSFPRWPSDNQKGQGIGEVTL